MSASDCGLAMFMLINNTHARFLILMPSDRPTDRPHSESKVVVSCLPPRRGRCRLSPLMARRRSVGWLVSFTCARSLAPPHSYSTDVGRLVGWSDVVWPQRASSLPSCPAALARARPRLERCRWKRATNRPSDAYMVPLPSLSRLSFSLPCFSSESWQGECPCLAAVLRPSYHRLLAGRRSAPRRFSSAQLRPTCASG